MGSQKEDIGVLLAQVRHQNQNQYKYFKQFKREITTQCKSAQGRLNNSLKNLNQAVNSATLAKNQWIKTATKARGDRKSATESVKKSIGSVHALEERLSKYVFEYKVVAQDAEKNLLTIKALLDIIYDEIKNKRGGSSFVQLKNFKTKLDDLKSALNNSNQSLYAPVISTLLDLATEQNFSDQGVLTKIISNLKALRSNIKSFRKKQEASLDTEVSIIRKQIKNAEQRIDVYRRLRVQAVSQGVDAKRYIRFYTSEIEHYKNLISTKNAEITAFNKICAFERKSLKRDVTRAKLSSKIIASLFSGTLKLAN